MITAIPAGNRKPNALSIDRNIIWATSLPYAYIGSKVLFAIRPSKTVCITKWN